jgi:putative sugar O-methyltransferase
MGDLSVSCPIDDCQQLMGVMALQDRLYQPGHFWQEASKVLLSYLAKDGIEDFRRLQASLWFFVPTYGFPGNALSEAQIKEIKKIIEENQTTEKQKKYLGNFLSGYTAALADYRVLSATEYASNKNPKLLSFSESSFGRPKEHFEIENNFYSRSALNYLLGLAFLKQYLDFSTINNILEIGGGFGTLGEIVNQLMPSKKYINIDIPPTLCFSKYYLQNVVGLENFSCEDVVNFEFIEIEKLKQITTIPSWKIESLNGKVDLFVNFISFQEMEPEIVKNYLQHVDRLNAEWILLRNMREGKATKDVKRYGVEKPILSDDYKSMLKSYSLVDVNVIPFGFKTVDGFHSELMLFRRNKES